MLGLLQGGNGPRPQGPPFPVDGGGGGGGNSRGPPPSEGPPEGWPFPGFEGGPPGPEGDGLFGPPPEIEGSSASKITFASKSPRVGESLAAIDGRTVWTLLERHRLSWRSMGLCGQHPRQVRPLVHAEHPCCSPRLDCRDVRGSPLAGNSYHLLPIRQFSIVRGVLPGTRCHSLRGMAWHRLCSKQAPTRRRPASADEAPPR